VRGSASPVLTVNTVAIAISQQNGRWQFSTPPQNPHPLTDHQKIGTGDYSAAPTAVPNLVQIRRWGLLRKWVKYNEFFLFRPILFFINLTTGQIRRRIFTLHDGSKDADSRKDVPFGNFVNIAPHFGGEIPRKPQFWA